LTHYIAGTYLRVPEQIPQLETNLTVEIGWSAAPSRLRLHGCFKAVLPVLY